VLAQFGVDVFMRDVMWGQVEECPNRDSAQWQELPGQGRMAR